MSPRVFPQDSVIVSVPNIDALDLAFRSSLSIMAKRQDEVPASTVGVLVGRIEATARLTPVVLPNGVNLAILTIDCGDGTSLFTVIKNDLNGGGWRFAEGARVAQDARELDGLKPSHLLQILGY